MKKRGSSSHRKIPAYRKFLFGMLLLVAAATIYSFAGAVSGVSHTADELPTDINAATLDGSTKDDIITAAAGGGGVAVSCGLIHNAGCPIPPNDWTLSQSAGSFQNDGQGNTERLCCYFYPASELTTYKLVFISSAVYNANLGGVTGADDKCQELANAQGFVDKTFKAWIATSSLDDPESTFTKSTIPYALRTGITIANDWFDLVDGGLIAKINIDESGTVVTSANAWTNVNADGTVYGTTGWDYSCMGWTSTTQYAYSNPPGYYVWRYGYYGSNNYANTAWTLNTRQSCYNTVARLYCFEQ